MGGYEEIERMTSGINEKMTKSEPLTDKQYLDILDRAETLKNLNPSQDYSDGKVWYGVLFDEKKYIVNSRGKLCPFADIVEGHKLQKNSIFSKSKVSPECLRRFQEEKIMNPGDLFTRLQNFFKDYAIYKLKNTPAVLAVWVMGTYIYQIFRFYGYLWFNSPTKRSGKSQCLELISCVAFNSTSVQTTPSLPYLFREVAANGSTICLDEVEGLNVKDKEKFGEIMSLLNVGFKRGGTVGRCELKNKTQIPVNFPAYGPKVFAGINSMIDTLVDRSFKIEMLKKKPTEKIKRFDLHRLETEIKKMVDDLYLFGLIYGPKIAEVYNQENELGIPKRLDDRAKDIFEPLFAIADVIDQGNQEKSVTGWLNEFALEQAGIREDAEQDESAIVQVVEILTGVELHEDGTIFLTPNEVFDLFKDHPGLEWVKSKNQAGRLLGKLDLKSKPDRERGRVERGYLLTKAKIGDLKERYLPPDSPTDTVDSVTPVTIDGGVAKNGSVTQGDVTNDIFRSFQNHFPSMKVKPVTDVTD